MSNKSQFSLPTSSYEVITKILHAYVLCGDKPATLQEVSSKAGLNKTQVSGNNAFLSSIGLLEGGKQKTLTSRGKNLALAIANKLQADIASAWSSALMDAEPTKAVLEMIKVQNGVIKKDLSGKIAQSLKLPASKSAQTKTGINALIEIATRAGVLEESGDKYVFCAWAEGAPAKQAGGDQATQGGAKAGTHESVPKAKAAAPIVPPPLPQSALPGVHIDVQIHVAADAKPEQIDQIFASLAKHLYQRG